ncbi:selenocysteine-specific translation elongation factor [Bacillota bacterium LX-D]|nr:selenocysteine-specific translation elongation factor [Bacillota bacterium LX-D]
MNYVIVGTAGHVDHGKTELVKALTGINTDRLKEEQQRGISIELGFAPLELPGGLKVGLVDVPGHEKFIKQMLAGAGGMDLVLLAVAADEGIMPQTREHLDIINLLQIKKGIVVITKVDLVDEDWLELIKEDVQNFLKGTILENAPILCTSAYAGTGIEELKKVLEKMVSETKPKTRVGQVRLPIDRIFSITGFGTVVTGTLWTGEISVGQILEIMPEKLTTRVRSLQVHGQQVEKAYAGQRVAANLAGLEVTQIKRGSAVVTPNVFTPSYRIDVEFYLLPCAAQVENRQRVRIHLGTSEILGRIILLDRDVLVPGEKAFVQLQLENVLVAGKGDRLVVRSYSPMQTIGGGTVIDPVAGKHKRFDAALLATLAVLAKGTPEELLLEALQNAGDLLLTKNELADKLNLPGTMVDQLVEVLLTKGLIVQIDFDDTSWVADKDRLDSFQKNIEQFLGEYHQKYYLRFGLSKEELRSRKFSKAKVKIFNALLSKWVQDNFLRVENNYVALKGFIPTPSLKEQKLLERIAAEYLSAVFQPPLWSEVLRKLALSEDEGNELLKYLLWKKTLYKIDEELYFHQQSIKGAQELLKQYIEEHGSIQLSEARDLLQSSRKYVLPLLEYFDKIKFTKRIQDKRVLVK